MDLALIKLSLERIIEKVESLEEQNRKLKKQVKELEKIEFSQPIEAIKEVPEDVLIDTKEVLTMLGICYNTLQKIVRNNFLTPIRISTRRLRFSKQTVLDYINSRSD